MRDIFDALTIDHAQFERERDRLIRIVLGAAKGSITDETRQLEKDLEAATKSAVPGRLWRAWKSEVFPKGPGIARQPSGVVYVNGGERSSGVMTFFTKPGRIKGRSGQYLAIPTAAAGSRGRKRDLTPGEWERRHGVRLRFVYRKTGASMLVLDEGVLSGKKKIAKLNTERRRATGRGNTTIVIFFLVPMVAFANSISIEPIINRAKSRLPDRFVARLRSAER